MPNGYTKATDLIHSRLVSPEVTKNVDIFCPPCKMNVCHCQTPLGFIQISYPQCPSFPNGHIFLGTFNFPYVNYFIFLSWVPLLSGGIPSFLFWWHSFFLILAVFLLFYPGGILSLPLSLLIALYPFGTSDGSHCVSSFWHNTWALERCFHVYPSTDAGPFQFCLRRQYLRFMLKLNFLTHCWVIAMAVQWWDGSPFTFYQVKDDRWLALKLNF